MTVNKKMKQYNIILLIPSAKIPEREGSFSPSRFYWATAWLLVTHASIFYLGDVFFSFVHGVAEQNENAWWIYDFTFLFLVIVKGIRERNESKISLGGPRGLGALRHSICKPVDVI